MTDYESDSISYLMICQENLFTIISYEQPTSTHENTLTIKLMNIMAIGLFLNRKNFISDIIGCL